MTGVQTCALPIYIGFDGISTLSEEVENPRRNILLATVFTCVAIGLLSEPSVLLLDEPSASLDPRQRERLWEFISALADRGTTVVFSTHNVAEVERYASRVLLLADGELLFTGTPSELEAAVGGDPRDFEHALVNFLHQHGH